MTTIENIANIFGLSEEDIYHVKKGMLSNLLSEGYFENNSFKSNGRKITLRKIDEFLAEDKMIIVLNGHQINYFELTFNFQEIKKICEDINVVRPRSCHIMNNLILIGMNMQSLLESKQLIFS